MTPIPLSRPPVDDEIKQAVLAAIDSRQYVLGPQCRHLEAELAAATGDQEFHDAGRRALAAFAEAQEKPGLAAADWALAQRALLDPESPAPPDWRASALKGPETPRVIRFGGKRRR